MQLFKLILCSGVLFSVLSCRVGTSSSTPNDPTKPMPTEDPGKSGNSNSTNGQTSGGTTGTQTPAASKVASLRKVAVGKDFACLINNGVPACWGSAAAYYTPKGNFATGLEEISVGLDLSCGLKAGQVKCIYIENTSTTGEIDGPGSGETDRIYNDGGFSESSCARMKDATMRCWGPLVKRNQFVAPTGKIDFVRVTSNSSIEYLQEGKILEKSVDGTSNSAPPNESEIGLVDQYASLYNSDGFIMYCAIKDGKLRCSAKDSSSNAAYKQVTIEGGISNSISEIVSGYNTSSKTFCLLADGKVNCYNTKKTSSDKYAVYLDNTDVPSDLGGGIEQLSSGRGGFCALKQGKVRCWGSEDDIRNVPSALRF